LLRLVMRSLMTCNSIGVAIEVGASRNCLALEEVFCRRSVVEINPNDDE
jgi:hypothetical protein